MVEPAGDSDGLLADLRTEMAQLWPLVRNEARLHKDTTFPISIADLDGLGVFLNSESKNFIQFRGLMHVIEEIENQKTPERYLRQMRSLWPTVRIKLGVPDDLNVEMPEDLGALNTHIRSWYQRTQGEGGGFILSHFRGLLFLSGGPIDKG